jgi:hypothetical protein
MFYKDYRLTHSHKHFSVAYSDTHCRVPYFKYLPTHTHKQCALATAALDHGASVASHKLSMKLAKTEKNMMVEVAVEVKRRRKKIVRKREQVYGDNENQRHRHQRCCLW